MCLYGNLAEFPSVVCLGLLQWPHSTAAYGSLQGGCFVVNHRKSGLRPLPAAVSNAGTAPEAGERQGSRNSKANEMT